ncbi:Os01g0820800 [Oryza sativa Japonica Group]|jgi:hypothetical protein|uniref:Uncharacterized protein n=3 Tax=Oryza sativa TaxID=4530 RepID=A0A8J8XHX8_ORYSJ|nr:hypothetical protein OsI_04234 [Oryza sativa Indica Group]EAZ13966.1 hypothetical protein OsJ_03893 [Oryza sativa Japonica Group]KAB8084067.1 hypothetical protein EE612_006518 [Oryza sativa]BAS74971.1 Os01g0820800 [Oryza sativa Japonica Group]
MDGDGYGDGSGTRDFMSQSDSHADHDELDPYTDSLYYTGSRSGSASRIGMAALDLNSGGDGWPDLGSYEGLL